VGYFLSLDNSAENHFKRQTQKQWNASPCGKSSASEWVEFETLDFFEAVRKSRYEVTDQWMTHHIPFHLGKSKKLLEIGYGMGTDLLQWRKNGAEVFGIDITSEHYRLANLNFQLHGETADLRLADAADIPFPANHFDIVYSNGVLHHTPDTIRCISEAYRVLKPGGQLILSLYYKYSAFHLLFKILADGIWHGNLRKLGYEGLMSTIEHGADGINVKPLVKTYTKSQLRTILSDFSSVDIKIANLKHAHIPKIGKILPNFLVNILDPYLGWYIIAYATKGK